MLVWKHSELDTSSPRPGYSGTRRLRAGTVGARVIVDRNYRGCRIEVEAKLANGLWDAHVRIFRAPSELVHVETIICQQPTAAIAEEGSVIRARRWVDGQSGRSLPKTVRVAFAVAALCGLIAFALAVALLIEGDSLARASLILAFSLVLLRAAVGVRRGDWRAAWLTVTLGVVAVLFSTRPTTLLLAVALLATSFVAAVRLHARRRTPAGHGRSTPATTRIVSMGGALLMRWWGWARVMIGAAFPEPPVGIVVALGVAWLIGLSIAAGGVVGTVGLVVMLGLGMTLTVLPLILIGRFIMWLLRKRQERHR